MKRNQMVEKIIHGIFLMLGLITVGCVLLITVYLVIQVFRQFVKLVFLTFCLEKNGLLLHQIRNTAFCLLF